MNSCKSTFAPPCTAGNPLTQQLTLKKHRFELHRSTYMWSFFINTSRVFFMHSWESTDAEGQLYALIYANIIGDLSIHRFWYPWGFLESIPSEYWGKTKFWGSQKLYEDFDCYGGLESQPVHCSRVNCIPIKPNFWFK